jgi:hypothetical protein
MKLCPKCRKYHAGVDEELAAENEHQGHEHEHEHSHGSSRGSPNQPQTPVTAEPTIPEVAPAKSTATVVTSSVLV